jgi:hypothetical protein
MDWIDLAQDRDQCGGSCEDGSTKCLEIPE